MIARTYTRATRTPASCELYVPEAQGSVPGGAALGQHGTSTAASQVCRMYRVPVAGALTLTLTHK